MREIDRAIAILKALSVNHSGLGITELSNMQGIPKSSIHRMLNELIKHRFVYQDKATRKYHLGPGLLRLAGNFLDRMDVRVLGRPYLQQLSDFTGESSFLTVLQNDEAICVETVEASKNIRFFVQVGRRMPFHCAASAKVLLAFQPEDKIEAILRARPLKVFTPRTITDIEELKKHLRAIRHQGYATCEQELEIGVDALATPVRNFRGEVVASISLLVPSEKMKDWFARRALEYMMQLSQQLSAQLGYEDKELNRA